MNKKKKRNGGFTLVELLATLAVLALVSSIVIGVSVNVINSARTKSYQTAKNNVLVAAGNYVVENPELTDWISLDSSNEYKCVTVAEMIELGYFNNDILDSQHDEDNKFKLDDAVYVGRDKTTKAMNKKEFNYGLCASGSIGSITFKENPVGWSSSKTITIEYNLNVNYDPSDAKYSYEYSSGSLKLYDTRFSSRQETRTINVSTNGTLASKIKVSNDKFVERRYVVSNIDNDNPVGTMKSLHKMANNQMVELKLSDAISGVKGFYFGKTYPNSSVKYENVANEKNVTLTKEVDSAGTWYLQVIDMAGNKSIVTSLTFFETRLNVSNVNITPNRILDVSGQTYTLSNIKIEAHNYYTINGWYENSNYTGNAITSYTTKSDEDYVNQLYGKVTENIFTSGTVTISGTPKYGNTLNVIKSNITLSNHDATGITYSYQWYYNNNDSITGGTLISGATSSTYKISESVIGKYLYVVVTAKKDNYRDGVFVSAVSSVVRKLDGYITLSSTTGSMKYNSTSRKTITITSHHGGVLSVTDNNITASTSIQNVATGNSSVVISSLLYAPVGTIRVTVTSGETTTHTSASATYTLTITKADNPISISGKIVSYTGSYQDLAQVVGAAGTVYYSTTTPLTSSNYSGLGKTTIPTGMDVGNYIVYYYVTGNNNYDSNEGSVNSRINRTLNPITVTGNTLNYNGEYQDLVTVSNAKGTVYYSTTTKLTSSNYSGLGSLTIPSGKDVGSYIVYYYVTGDDNYQPESGSKEVKIKEGTCLSYSCPVDYRKFGTDSCCPIVYGKIGDKREVGNLSLGANNICYWETDKTLDGCAFEISKIEQGNQAESLGYTFYNFVRDITGDSWCVTRGHSYKRSATAATCDKWQ